MRHTVTKKSCPAVRVVIEYLAVGGEHPSEPLTEYYPVTPARCPICGVEAAFDLKLSSRVRGAGWRCQNGGSEHYWEDRGNILAEKFAQENALKCVRSGT